MGLTSFKGSKVRKGDVTIAKNYWVSLSGRAEQARHPLPRHGGTSRPKPQSHDYGGLGRRN